MTTNLIDIQNSDVIMATSNFAENHPVGFQWVMKAKERGAKFIHVDPRFTRTSAVADIHVPLRSGTNIAFFGGLISYAIQNNLYFKDYVVHYTNASFLIDPAFKTATDGGGLFTGLESTGKGGVDPHLAETYKRDSWKYQLDGEGNPKRDLTLRDPNSVFQLMKRHYSRYTPEMVERVCGIPKEKFVQVAKLYCENSGPEKTGAITYALNLTQHTNGGPEHPRPLHAADPARQHRAAGGRGGRPARPRQRAGRDRPRAALPRAARLPARCRCATPIPTSRRISRR